MAYAVAGGLPKEIFRCPTDEYLSRSGVGDGLWTHYGLNGFGIAIEASSGTRADFFGGVTNELALFVTQKMPDPDTHVLTSQWVGRQLTRLRTPSETVFAQDHIEVTFDGNGDIPWNWYQHQPAAEMMKQLLRHNGTSNALFVDGHVVALTKTEQQDYRIYTGRPNDPLRPPVTP